MQLINITYLTPKICFKKKKNNTSMKIIAYTHITSQIDGTIIASNLNNVCQVWYILDNVIIIVFIPNVLYLSLKQVSVEKCDI